MKWLIRGVGMLTALFAVFFFLLVADKLYYQNTMDTYEISLDRSLSGREIQNSIYVEAHHAKGTVHIQQKGGKKGAH